MNDVSPLDLDRLSHMGDYGMGELVRLMFDERVCYDLGTKQWFLWTGSYWKADTDRSMRRALRKHLPMMYSQWALNLWKDHAITDEGRAKIADDTAADQHKRANKLASSLRRDKTFKEVYSVCMDEFAVDGSCWDSMPCTIACPNGTVEIADDGISFRHGRPSDFNRTVTGAQWKGIDEPCPLWNKVIDDAMLGDQPNAEYLRQLIGYSILGITEQHVFPCLVGEGRNGKSVIVEAIQRVLGGYAHTGTDDLIVMKNRGFSDSANPSLAALQGKRFTTVSETREGAILNTAQVKMITGGDSITARMLNSNPVTFTPTHTLFLITNHKPHINSDDFAAWQRVKAIEFKAKYVTDPSADNERLIDESIPRSLIAEDSGILASLAMYAWTYLAGGHKLDQPDSIAEATIAYRDEEDVILEFVSTECATHKEAKVKCNELYSDYCTWFKNGNMGRRPMSSRSFASRIRKMGYQRGGNGRSMYIGIGRLLMTDITY